MLSPSYLIRVLKGMSLDKYKEVLDRTAKFSGMSKAAITADMAKCAVKFGAGYFDYVTFGFWDLTDEQRDTFLTRLRNKKLISHFIFCKPVDGSCGHGCMKKNLDDYADFDEMYRELLQEDSWLLEEVLKQHPDNEKVYPYAMNCLRIITVVDKQRVPHVIFATQKFGLNGRVVDNYGFGTRVDLETGKICSPGVSGDGSMAIVYDEHPMTHYKLMGHQVPMFKEACELAKQAALVVPQVRYVGWDIGITPDGPAIVEGNNYCAHDFWQLPAQTPEKTGILPVFEAIEPDLHVR